MLNSLAAKSLALLLLQTVAAMPALNARDGLTCPTANSTVVTVSNVNFGIECGIDTIGGDMPSPNGQSYSTFTQCIQSCVSRSGCQAVAYMGQACYLKGSIPPRRAKASVWGAVMTTNEACPAPAVVAAAVAAPAASTQAAVQGFGQIQSVQAAAAPAASTKAAVQAFGAIQSVAAAPAAAAASPAAAVVAGVSNSYVASPAVGGSSSGSSSSGSCARPAAKALSTKRGVAYNDISLVNPFIGKASWCYNWGGTPGGTVPSGIEYIPMLWSPSNGGAQWNSVATAAIAAGADTLLGFNEPDQVGQSDMTVAAAVAGWKQYMEPLKCQARLASPSVTNGGAPMGLTYLSNFIAACTGCTIDVVVIHWYDSATNFAYFQQHVQDAYTAGGNRPVWITEFGASGTLEQQEAFFAQAIPFLDSTPYVERYSYFMASVGNLVESSTQLSPLGQAYVSA